MTRWFYAAAAASLLLCSAASADEGMWTFHGFPFAKANSQLKTSLDQAWLDRVRLSTVRIASCTGSFVSSEGLILTNHHCVESCLAELSNKDKSYIDDGYLAKTREQELRCQTQVADVLTEMEDITAKITAATAGKDDAAANTARKTALTQLEQQCETTSGLKCQSVSLYEGGQYWLYKYKRYTDLRLVFAPEAGIAAFGGDPDNFQFPRWCLDMGILRAYENGVPVKPANYLHVNFAGAAAGDPVFVSGHPGTTERLLTLSQLKQRRNQDLPQWLLRYSEIRGRLIQFAETSPENERISADLLNNIENSIKVRRKQLDALHDDSLLARKATEEAALQQERGEGRETQARAPAIRGAISTPRSPPSAASSCPTPSSRTAPASRAAWWVSGARWCAPPPSATSRTTPVFGNSPTRRCRVSSSSWARRCRCIRSSRSCASATACSACANGWVPIIPVVRKLLAKESPAELARRVITGSKLADPAVRMALWKGGSAAVAASSDPVIELWRSVDARGARRAQGVRRRRRGADA